MCEDKDRTRQNFLLNSAQFHKTYRLNLHRKLNTVQLRNNEKEKDITIKEGASWDHPNSKG